MKRKPNNDDGLDELVKRFNDDDETEDMKNEHNVQTSRSN